MKKLKFLVIFMLIIMLALSSFSFAGMADWDDKTADEESKNLLQEQEKEHSGMEDKSSNNYLESLKVEGHEFTFNKQTVNYDIGEVEEKTINIEAILEDEKATVNGAGKVELKEGENDIRVDVISESGTTRTYHIKATYKPNNKTEDVNGNVVTNNEENTEVKINEEEQTKVEEDNNTLISVGIVAVIIIIVFLAIKQKKR